MGLGSGGGSLGLGLFSGEAVAVGVGVGVGEEKGTAEELSPGLSSCDASGDLGLRADHCANSSLGPFLATGGLPLGLGGGGAPNLPLLRGLTGGDAPRLSSRELTNANGSGMSFPELGMS